jgi:surfactin synthase thioesterase subunit
VTGQRPGEFAAVRQLDAMLVPLEPADPGGHPPHWLTLVAVPHAGGTPHAFRCWTGPARARGVRLLGARTSALLGGLRQPTVKGQALRLASALQSIDGPYALLGHSLGGLLAIEAALYLERHAAQAAPALLVACAVRPPHLPGPVAGPFKTEDEAGRFLAGLRGTPPQVLHDPGARALAVEMLQGDLAMLDGYRWDGSRARTPMGVYAGRSDTVVPPKLLARWGDVAERVSARQFDGGHFFLHDRLAEVLDAVTLDMASARH